MAVDVSTGDLWWTDNVMDSIQKVNARGGGRTIKERFSPNPVGITLLKDSFYWADRNMLKIFKLPKVNWFVYYIHFSY